MCVGVTWERLGLVLVEMSVKLLVDIALYCFFCVLKANRRLCKLLRVDSFA